MGESATILFLGANPSNTTRLALDREAREIDERLQASRSRDAFRVEKAWAVRASDLHASLLRFAPTIVHFSGHGSEEGELLLEDVTGAAKPVTTAAIADLFRILGAQIRCVVLNACYSEAQARAIAEHVDVVVGMSTALDDSAAIAFAGAFYQALGFNQDVQTAFELGCNQIMLADLADADAPKLLVRPGTDARSVRLAQGGRRRPAPAVRDKVASKDALVSGRRSLADTSAREPRAQGAAVRSGRAASSAEIDAKARVEIARLNAQKWILCVLIAAVAGVLMTFMGTVTLILLAGGVSVLSLVFVTKANSVAQAAAHTGFRAVVAVLAPTAVSMVVALTASAVTHPEIDGPRERALSPAVLFVPPDEPQVEAISDEDHDELSIVIESEADACIEQQDDEPITADLDLIEQATGARGIPTRLSGRRLKKPRVRMGSSFVSGRLPPEVIIRIIKQNAGRFRLCYENGLRINPSLQGRVGVRFVIGRDGAVSNVGNGGSEIEDAEVVSCVVRAFYGLSFPQPEGGIATVVSQILLRPSARSGPPVFKMKRGLDGEWVMDRDADPGVEPSVEVVVGEYGKIMPDLGRRSSGGIKIEKPPPWTSFEVGNPPDPGGSP